MATEYTVMLESASSSDTAELMTIDELIIESTVKVEQIAIFELRNTDKFATSTAACNPTSGSVSRIVVESAGMVWTKISGSTAAAKTAAVTKTGAEGELTGAFNRSSTVFFSSQADRGHRDGDEVQGRSTIQASNYFQI